MVLRTETYKELEEDLATIMDIDETFLFESLSEISKDCFDGAYIDWDKYEEQIDNLILEYADLSVIDEVYVYHLGRHMIEPKELIPLNKLLVSENKLSKFLKDYEIFFEEQDGKVKFLYKGKLILPEEVLSRGNFNLLARRLGYLDEADFCVNGFSFWPNIEKTSDGYFYSLQRGPEVIENIGRFIGIDLWRVFKEKSKYYGIVFKVPIEELIFDQRTDLESSEEKVKHLIKYALIYLNDFYNNSVYGNNLMLRISDNKNVEVDHCILINEEKQ